MTEDDTCEACQTNPEWTWFDGKFAGGEYCVDCIRGQLDTRERFPDYRDEITTAENATTIGDHPPVRVVPAGARPIGEVYPTIRTQEALDEWLAKQSE